MFFRGDHTFADFFLTVLPPATETVVFSIDGSFTASMSISGKAYNFLEMCKWSVVA